MICKPMTLILTLIVVVLTGCAPAAPPANQPQTSQPQSELWKTFRADSGYEIQYPTSLYSLRDGRAEGPDILFPGAKVLEPNDAFTFQEPRAVTYKLSIAASVNSQNLSLDNPEQLLANGQFIVYDPALLAGHEIQQTTLDGVPALQVDELPTGPTGISAQIVAIYNTFRYELLIEPYQLVGNQAEPPVEGAALPANRELVDQIIATFRFTDEAQSVDTPVTAPAAAPVVGEALVESVEIVMLESFPVQVQAVVRGSLADACTQLGEIRQQRAANEFQVNIATVRATDCIGAQVLTPFEQTVALDGQSLPAGTYSVSVNEVRTEFTLAVDNTQGTPPPVDTTATPASGEQTAPGVQGADVQYVMAQTDVPIYGGAPGDTSTQIGFVAGGQVARVTGVSPDGVWWRVMCPDDSMGDCWVAADPSQTQPATAP